MEEDSCQQCDGIEMGKEEVTGLGLVQAGRDGDALDLLSRDKTATPPDNTARSNASRDGSDDEGDTASRDKRLDQAAGAKEDEADDGKVEDKRRRSSVDSDDLEERVNRAKTLARSEIKAHQWDRYNFSKLDLDKELGPFGDDLMRVHCDQMPLEQFVQDFEIPCRPCIIQGLLKSWPASSSWSFAHLAERFPDARLKCGEDDDGYKVKLRLEYFVEYARRQRDDSPLYVFDADFGDDGKPTQPLLSDFSVPSYFREDLFQYCGEDRRPPYRWLLLGPARSGSTIHIDPLATSAWNAVIKGRKLWALFPPGTPKAIVKPQAWMDRKDREAIDWFLYHLPRIRQTTPPHLRPLQCVTHPGETIFVPGGWWHTVLNLDDTVAVTQNFCSTTCFPAVWSETVTGRTKLSRRWLRKLQSIRPDLYQIAQNLAGTGNGLVTAEAHIEQLLADKAAKKERKKANKRHRKEKRESKARSSRD